MKREIKIKKMFEFIKNESEKRKVFVVSSFGDTLDIVEQAMKIIAGTARQMGVEVKD